MYSLAQTKQTETQASDCIFRKPRKNPFVLETRIDLKPGDVIRSENVCTGKAQCLADNPITGPFSDSNDIIGRVVAIDMPAGTVITGVFLQPLGPMQMESRLRNFWRRCR